MGISWEYHEQMYEKPDKSWEYHGNLTKDIIRVLMCCFFFNVYSGIPRSSFISLVSPHSV